MLETTKIVNKLKTVKNFIQSLRGQEVWVRSGRGDDSRVKCDIRKLLLWILKFNT